MAARLLVLANLEPGRAPGQYAYPGLDQPKCLWQAGNLQSWEMLSMNASEHRRCGLEYVERGRLHGQLDSGRAGMFLRQQVVLRALPSQR